jgi:hypothetical protein
MILDVFEVRTDQGGNPIQHKAGRIWREGAGVRVLERWSTDGLLLPSESNPWISSREIGVAPPALSDLSALRPASFEYRRVGSPTWERIEISGDSAAMNGAALAPQELERIVRNVQNGVAEVRYGRPVPENPPIHKAWKEPKIGTDITTDSEVNLPNLIAFETATYPIAWIILRSYDRAWRDDPRSALELARLLAQAAKGAGGHWYHLWAGQFAREVADEREAVAVASALRRGLVGTAADAAGRADILVMAPTSSEPDFAGLAARCPSGSACLVGDRMVVL